MQSQIEILSDPIQPRIRIPRLGKEGYRNGLSIIVQRQSDCSYGIHHRRVVNDEYGNVESVRSQEEIRMRRRAEMREVNFVQPEKLVDEIYPNGSPTTRNEMSRVSASFSISSDSISTISRSATIISFP